MTAICLTIAGEGYEYLADSIITQNKQNPQTETPLTHWKKYQRILPTTANFTFS